MRAAPVGDSTTPVSKILPIAPEVAAAAHALLGVIGQAPADAGKVSAAASRLADTL